MHDDRRPALPPIPAVLLAIVSVQGGAALAKSLFSVLGAAGTTGVRVGLSALMLLLVFRPLPRRITTEQWRLLLAYGVLLGAMNLVFYLALARIPLGLAVTLEFVGPLTLAVIGSRRAPDFLWVTLAAAGIALITPWRGAGPDPVGMLLALGAGACWAAYIVVGGRISRMMPGGSAVAVGMVVATCLVLPFSLAGGGLAHLTPRLLLTGAAVALLSSALPYTLEMSALRALPARTFTIMMSLEPAVAAICGLLFLHESLTWAQWIAVTLVIAASAGAAATGRQVPVPVEC
jgi:inner membrane transporter RhtA